MTASDRERLKDVLHHALQLEPEQRSRYLDEVCSDEIELRAEVESLLAADARMLPGFMPSIHPQGRSNGLPGRGELEAGETFDQRFVLVRKLGEGGMGQVWLARQTSPVVREVALKLVKAGMYDQEVVQRFSSERQSLAIMDHPAIAKVFDAGTTPQGQPYFVMEYVPGLPLTNYCDQHRLSLPLRFELFIQVCAAVQHAHHKAIVHRDLKPPNILVIEVDRKPVPRIIDFGLAKAMHAPTAATSYVTQMGQFMGTPGYMSPEQAGSGVQDIDTRADVYSLGVVLYELLVGVRPFDESDVDVDSPPPLLKMIRSLCEEDPPTPSMKLRSLVHVGDQVAHKRGIPRRQLANLLRGDLDWIALKALARNREQRYGSPAELGADLRRYLNHEPVIARPTSSLYRLRKYSSKHRLGVSIAAGLAVLLVAVAVLQTLNVYRLARERDRVDRERVRAVHVTDLLAGMFKLDAQDASRANTISAREILDQAIAATKRDLANDPDAQAQMLHLIARAYLNLGLFEGAHRASQDALDLRIRLHGPDDARSLESMAQLGSILGYEGQSIEAQRLEREALARELRVLGPDNALTHETQHKLTIIESSVSARGN